MNSKLIEKVSTILRQVAQEEILAAFREGFAQLGWEKAPGELVTEVDGRAEQRISAALRQLLPGSVVIGEEASAADPSLLDRVGSASAWLLDPLDGTRNFAAGRPPFAVMLALLEHGRTVAAWILDPLNDELIVAERGGGAWRNGERLACCAGATRIAEARAIVSGAFTPAKQREWQDRLERQLLEVRSTQRCAGAEYPLLAGGNVDLILYWRTLPWDHAPGVLVVEESGAAVRQFDGSTFDPVRPRVGLISAASEALLDEVLALARGTGAQ